MKKKYTYKERLEKIHKSVIMQVSCGKIKRSPFPFVYMNLPIFFSVYCFYNQEKPPKKKKMVHIYLLSSSSIMTTYSITTKTNPKLGNLGYRHKNKEFCFVYNKIEKQIVCTVSNNNFYLRGNCGVLLSCER